MREYNRLLYVALTRAEDRLVICGWDTKRAVPDTSWYRMVERGFAALGATPEPFTLGWGESMLACETPQTRPPTEGKQHAEDLAAAALPAWAGRPGDWRPGRAAARTGNPHPARPQPPDGRAVRPRSPRRLAVARRDRAALPARQLGP